MTNRLNILFERNTPRWIIFAIDLGICLFSLVLAYLLRFNFSIPPIEIQAFKIVFPVVLATRALSFVISRTYKGIVKYTGSKDAQRIFIVVTVGSLFFVLFNLVNYRFVNHTFPIPFSIIIIDYMATTFLMISLRVMFKALYFEIKNPSRGKSHVVIFGAGESGIITKRTLDRDAGTKYKVVAFIDDDKKKQDRKLEGITIHPADKLETFLQGGNIAHVIISMQDIPPSRKQEIIELCLKYNTKVLNVPPVHNWINGELSFKQIRKVKIEELLERDPIKLNEDNIRQQIHNKVVLVTGAAGSIGSEIVRQVIRYEPKLLILLDQAETPLYEIDLEILEKLKPGQFEIVIGDIRVKERMDKLFSTFKPQLIFHAAAYKHVPMMENNPSESILTNVLGTKIIADLANTYKAETFVLVSTDKAVNPTSIMGASKRIGEIYVQSLNKKSTTKYITTRFGNVLGSSGSVIPRFRQQIENGGPVTITHPDITRYFMTIPEACQLVLEAGAMGKGGEIFIFDMGKSVKIVDLAKKMIQLSGMTLDKDIYIKYTGLRPGEKLYEELLNNSENIVPTHHAQILIAKVREYDYEIISGEIDSLISLFDKQDNFAIVGKMKHIVPEYKSNNSVFEKLDTPSTNNE
ncbi:MAG: polysaccharide biosynthesis protein [Bacteroidetes bacterium]|nr:polysaccharide biosynthesis protein [Bacteroidota bacterium]